VSAPPYPWWVEPAAFLGATVLRLLGATWRAVETRAPEYTSASAGGEKFVFAFWHARILSLTHSRRGEGITVLVSRHRDGQLITRVIEHLGYTVARGSSTRGGDAGVRELLAMAESGKELALTPDGPRGPSGVVKEGVVYVATRLGRRVVPIAAAASDAWVLRSWDRFRIPKPFARVRYVYGPPIDLGAGGEPARLKLEQALHALQAETERSAGERA
jgi:lysophospholipid acyltransferase (LPLAT)-like uncharacterized protein